MTPAENIALGHALMEAVQAGDYDAIRNLFSDDIAIWHTFDQLDQNEDQFVRGLAWLHKYVKGLRYDDIRIAAVEGGGYVQQHVMRIETPRMEQPAMMRAWCFNGKITRIEEYMDSAHAVPLVEFIADAQRQKNAKA